MVSADTTQPGQKAKQNPRGSINLSSQTCSQKYICTEREFYGHQNVQGKMQISKFFTIGAENNLDKFTVFFQIGYQ